MSFAWIIAFFVVEKEVTALFMIPEGLKTMFLKSEGLLKA
jgi:hypothetical protein